MAKQIDQKKGLTTFGWLALGATAFALLRSPERREKILGSVRGLGDKFKANSAEATPAE